MYDAYLFIRCIDSSITLAAIYVDDIILTGDNIFVMTALKEHLHKVFTIKDLGQLRLFLGIEINYFPTGISMTQQNFTLELNRDNGVTQFKYVITPLPINLKLQKDNPHPFLILNCTEVLWVNLVFLLILALTLPI